MSLYSNSGVLITEGILQLSFLLVLNVCDKSAGMTDISSHQHKKKKVAETRCEEPELSNLRHQSDMQTRQTRLPGKGRVLGEGCV